MTATHDSGDELAVDLVVSTARFVRLVRRSSPGGESTATWRALAILEEAGPIRLGDFAERDRLSQPAATAMIRRLVDEGAVVREPDPDDGRAHLLHLSDEGRDRLARQRADGVAAVGPLLDGLDEHERETLREAAAIFERLSRTA